MLYLTFSVVQDNNTVLLRYLGFIQLRARAATMHAVETAGFNSTEPCECKFLCKWHHRVVYPLAYGTQYAGILEGNSITLLTSFYSY